MRSISEKKIFEFQRLLVPNRIQILELLSREETCVCAIVKKLRIKHNLVSHHLGVLSEMKYVKGRRMGQHVRYHIVEDKRGIVKELLYLIDPEKSRSSGSVVTQWDLLSNFFDIRKVGDVIEGGAMDNILVAWPPIVRLINEVFEIKKGLKALDYGCGVGEFCHKLYELGFDVLGVDFSLSMISKARVILPACVRTVVGDIEVLNPDEKFNLITAIQVFQFIENYKAYIEWLDKQIKKGGLFVIAVFNLDFVRNCIQENILLKDFDSEKNPKRGFFVLGYRIRIPVYIRSADEYKGAFRELGYNCVMEEYPPFTREFLEKYPLRVSGNEVAPSKDPEFMILGFRKVRNLNLKYIKK